ncbi:hypothetical protein Q7P37_002730 [Cladosporium fusiforme]
MNALGAASAYTGVDAFAVKLGGSQSGILPNYHDQTLLNEQPLGYAPGLEWNLMNDFAVTNGPTEANLSPASQQTPENRDFSPSTVDPTSLWSDSGLSYKDATGQGIIKSDLGSTSPCAISNTVPSSTTRQDSVPSNASFDSKPSYSTPPSSATQTDHSRSDRARHAANQRHKRSRDLRKDSHHAGSISEEPVDTKDAKDTKDSKADIKQLKLREKNKVAAAKCRSRQRKQVQNIESKCNHLSAANGELKRQIRDLSGELSDLRNIALNHQTCNCRIAMYNYHQAKKVVAGLQASSMGQNMTNVQEV